MLYKRDFAITQIAEFELGDHFRFYVDENSRLYIERNNSGKAYPAKKEDIQYMRALVKGIRSELKNGLSYITKFFEGKISKYSVYDRALDVYESTIEKTAGKAFESGSHDACMCSTANRPICERSKRRTPIIREVEVQVRSFGSKTPFDRLEKYRTESEEYAKKKDDKCKDFSSYTDTCMSANDDSECGKEKAHKHHHGCSCKHFSRHHRGDRKLIDQLSFPSKKEVEKLKKVLDTLANECDCHNKECEGEKRVEEKKKVRVKPIMF